MMKKKPLQVQPARKVYKPKYPSFEDKNPLLHPETRPYPFNYKFMQWATAGGLASIMLFSGNDLLAQTQKGHIVQSVSIRKCQGPVPASFIWYRNA